MKGAGGTTKQVVEQRSVVPEEGSEQVWHGKGDVLPVAVGEDMLLFGNPLLDAFEATAAARFGLATLTEEARMGAVRQAAAIASHTHGAGTAGKHAFDREFGPVAKLMSILLKKAFPTLIVLEQELCRAKYVHESQYKIRR